MRLTRLLAAFAAPPALAVAPSLAAQGAASSPVIGRWANPKATLAVETRPCGQGLLCGEIVWASPGALADARDAGVDHLVGTQLLQDYRAAGATAWEGRVYVPDMGRSFDSRISQTSPDTLAISGCLIGRLLCKTQVWRRLP